MIMKKENAKEFKGVNELEIGKDYVSVLYSKFIVIDRAGDFNNEAIYDDLYRKEIPCANCATWIEATEEEVIEAFERHLVRRYGEDWRTMKIKEMHPNATSDLDINDGAWCIKISKHSSGWNVWNSNGLLYRDGIWVERLEENKICIKDAIKENTVIHCETEEEAERILGMAHQLGYKWHTGKNYENNTEWGDCESTTCYYFFEGGYSDYDYFKKNDYTIIPSTQIADFEEKKSTDWSPAPEDIEVMKKEKASETQIGGSHYSNMAIQPTEFIHKNGLSFIQGNVIKYVCRYKDKGGIEDLNKAKHYIDLLIEFEELKKN